MPQYAAYGLTIDSELDFQGLPEGGSTPDAVIRAAHLEVPREARESPWNNWVQPHAAWFVDPACGAISIEHGQRILFDAPPAADPGIVRDWVLGPALATLLHQRGALVLHASAVEVAGGSVLFLGESGAGKSTAAMAMCEAGAAVVSDDLAVIGTEGDDLVVQPGSPLLRLLPESLRGFGKSPETALPASAPEKKRIAARRYAGGPLPLRRIYSLVPGTRYGITPMLARDAMMDLVWESFLAPILIDSGALQWNFERCAAVAATVPVYRLKRGQDIGQVARLAALVKDHLEAVLS